MTFSVFIGKFAAEFDETPLEAFNASTDFKGLDEWGSLVALSIISMIDEEFDKRLTGGDIRKAKTIEDLYNLVK